MMLGQGDVLKRILFVNRNVFSVLIKRNCFICKIDRRRCYNGENGEMETTLYILSGKWSSFT